MVTIEVNSLKRQIYTKSFKCNCFNSRHHTRNLKLTVIQSSKTIKTCSKSLLCLSKAQLMNKKAKKRVINDKSISCA